MEPGATAYQPSMRVLETGQPDYPPALLDVTSPPEAVWLRGRLPPGPRLAVVGARRCDAYGLEQARALGEGLGRAGVAVVSGGAAGVDTAALTACLEAGGQPVAVLGTGVDVAYPAANRGLFERIAAAGGLLSEYPPGTPGRRAHFPKRNRIISALALGVVVVRATPGSGSLITADWARRQGRVLMAVPGPVGDPLSAGCHGLLKAGAALVEDVADVMAAAGLTAANRAQLDLCLPRPTPGPQPDRPLSQAEARVVEALGDQPVPVDVIAERAGLEPGRAAALLLELALDGLVDERPGLVYARPGSGAAP